ncbi:hypothetical protein M9Y10_031592 [Tritrichomonas musculus]|uniref:DUF3447 domain-containing protein n=1 Tax=Tritrichomonas musculus TaxID=1915356 RepID=A0ABR2H117_9EUKA
MDIPDYLAEKKHLQTCILDYLDKGKNIIMENSLIKLLNDPKYLADKAELKAVLYLISRITNNHHRYTVFYDKIKEIFTHFKDPIAKNLSNREIFDIFRSNKRILLLLIKEKYLEVDQSISNSIQRSNFLKANYISYFLPEIKNFIDEQTRKEIKKDLLEVSNNNFGLFDDKRNVGENDSDVCNLIRKDSIDEFVKFADKNYLSFKSTIEESIFETNPFLIGKKPSLIEYASFFGSIQIIKFLVSKKVELTPSLWLYAVHGNNQELLTYLRDNSVQPPDASFKSCLVESIKCHHNEIADFIQNNLLSIQSDEKVDDIIFSNALKYLNYVLINQDLNDILVFYYLCQNDNLTLVEKLLNEKDLSSKINTKIVLKFFFCYKV